MNFSPQDLFDNGKYKLIALLGQGTAADVWLAEELKLKRKVVVKMLRESFWDPEARYRFEMEARALASIDHFGIIKLLSSDISSEGVMFLSIEYGGDMTLLDCINGKCEIFNSLSLQEKVGKLQQMVCALGNAHSRNVLHRDIKPNNILWDGDSLRLCDFGMAAIKGATGCTIDGRFIGNMVCPAPEQFEDGQTIDAATDVFNLGGVLYSALTGESFYGTSNQFAVQRSSVSGSRSWSDNFKSLPKPLRAILNKALQHDGDARYPTASEMCSDLKRYLNGEKVYATLERTHEQLIRWARYNPWQSALFLVLLLFSASLYQSTRAALAATSQTQEVLASFHGVMRGLDPNQPVTYGESQTSSLNDLFETLVASDSINSEVKAEIFYAIGTRHMFFDAFQEAERNFSQSLEHTPNNDLAIINLAWCERELGHQKRNDSERPLQYAKVIYDRALARLEPIINRDYPTGDVTQDYIILFAKNRYATLLLAELKSQSTTRALAILEKIDIELNSRSDIEPWLLPVNTGNRASVQARLENYQESLELHQLSERQFLAAGMANHPELSFSYVGQAGMLHVLGRVKESNAMSEKTLKHRRDIGGGYTNFYLRYLFDYHRRLLEYGSESFESVIARVLAEFDSRYHDNRREGEIDPELLSFHDQYCQLD